MVLIGWLTSCYRGREFDLKTNLKMAVLQIPLVTSVRMVWNTYQLNRWRRGLHFLDRPFVAKIIEDIISEASMFGVSESFLEAGPQLITQGFIICSTGHISYSQMISIPISLTSLTFAASKTFFTARDKDNRHPDPPFRMIVQNITPYMFIMVLSSTVIWSFITGIVGEYVIFGLAFNIIIVYLFLQIEKRCTRKPEKPDDMELMPPKEAKPTTDAESEESFNLQSALLSTWVPSVVGNSPKAFLVSGLVSLAVKFALLCVVYVSVTFSQFWVHARDAKLFIIWCLEAEFQEEYNTTVFCSQFGGNNSSDLPACFQIGSPEIVQKTRICNSDEMWLRLAILAVLMTCVVLSLISIIRLHQLTDWMTLTDSSTRCLCCIPCPPIYHRAALLKEMQKGTPDLEKFIDYYQDTGTKPELLNTTYANGVNAVELAAQQHMWDQWFVLMQHGGTSLRIVGIMLRAHREDLIQRLMENVFAPTISELVDREKDRLIGAVLSRSPYPGLSDLVAAGPQPAGEEDSEEAANEEEVSKYISSATALLQAGARPEYEVNQSGMDHWTYGESYLELALGVWAVAQGEEKMKVDKIVKILLKDFKVKIPGENNLKEKSIKKNLSAWNLAHKDVKIEDADVDDMTSDRLVYMEKGNMTLMEVQTSKDNKSVVRLRARYGEDDFGAWHVTGDGEEGEVSVVDVAGNGGGIDLIDSYHHTTTGSMLGLEAVTVSGEEFGWYGDGSGGDNTKDTLYRGDNRGQKLAYLTSRKRGDRFNINCHWD